MSLPGSFRWGQKGKFPRAPDLRGGGKNTIEIKTGGTYVYVGGTENFASGPQNCMGGPSLFCFSVCQSAAISYRYAPNRSQNHWLNTLLSFNILVAIREKIAIKLRNYLILF